MPRLKDIARNLDCEKPTLVLFDPSVMIDETEGKQGGITYHVPVRIPGTGKHSKIVGGGRLIDRLNDVVKPEDDTAILLSVQRQGKGTETIWIVERQPQTKQTGGF